MANTEKENLSPGNNNLTMAESEKPQNTVQVFFPCVHGEASGQLVTVSCFQASELKGAIKAVSGIDDETARRIIGAARYSETDDRAATGVIALFSNPLFGGESYGLALALADKMIRYGSRGKWTEIYATGIIPPDGCGTVEAIKEIERKLDLILTNGKPGGLFVFPENNFPEDAESLRQTLTSLEEKGINWIAINHLDQLDGKLWQSKNKRNSSERSGGIGTRIKNITSLFFSKTRSLYIYSITGILCFFLLLAGLLFLIYFILPESQIQQGAAGSAPKTTLNEKVSDSSNEKKIIIKQTPEDDAASQNELQLNSKNNFSTDRDTPSHPKLDNKKAGMKMGKEHMNIDDF